MYIKQVSIHWDKISEESYLRSIESIQSVNKIDFHKSEITARWSARAVAQFYFYVKRQCTGMFCHVSS